MSRGDPTKKTLAVAVGDRIQAFVAGLVGRPLFWVVFLCSAFALPLARSFARDVPKAPPAIGEVHHFALVDHDGRTLTRENLHGVVWVADFLPMSDAQKSDDLSKTMARVRYRTRNLSQAVHLVSITLDPTRDDLPARAEYAARFHASTASWSFLGGSEASVGEALSSFQLTTSGTPAMSEFSRRERLALVDQTGRIRGYYATDLSSLDALVADIGMVANETPAP